MVILPHGLQKGIATAIKNICDTTKTKADSSRDRRGSKNLFVYSRYANA